MKKFFPSSHCPWYPWLVSAYPALALLSANAGQVRAEAALRALLVSLSLGGLLFLTLKGVLKDTHRAAFLSALWLGLFFSFGHVKLSLDAENFAAGWLVYAWLFLFALAFFWATRPRLKFKSAAPILNAMSAALALMSAWQFFASVEVAPARAPGADHAPIQIDLRAPDSPPDVYYFILDSYARADFLQKVYQFDNSEFIHALEERGFYVAACSQSNYTRTELSLASSLNMSYLPELDEDFTPENTARRTLWNALKHSAARDNFERMGYQTVSFPNGFAWSELDDADFFYAPPPLSSGMTEFEGLLLDTTLARYLQAWGWVDADEVMGQTFRDRFENVFSHAADAARMAGGQFVHAHLISPHPPFVFDAQGNPAHPADFWNKDKKYPYDLYQKGYLNQLQYLNRRVLQAIDEILAESQTSPVIILQGDHGAWLQPKDRHMWIFNAYYLPHGKQKLYPSISPVNSFRLVFNESFGGNYELLPDASYYSPVPKLYDFSEIPNPCK